MNQEPELLVRDDENMICQSCGTTFDAQGKIVTHGLGDQGVEETA
jgi:hypothetical protein